MALSFAILFPDVNLTEGVWQAWNNFAPIERAVLARFVEFAFRLVAIVFILGWLFPFMEWYYRREKEKQPIESLQQSEQIKVGNVDSRNLFYLSIRFEGKKAIILYSSVSINGN